MATNLNGFLRNLTGPARLRSELRRSTLPLFTLLSAVNDSSSVGAKLPDTVLGGDIFGVMSVRLRHLLEVTTSSDTTTNRSRSSGQTWMRDFTGREPAKTWSMTRDEWGHRLVNSANSFERERESREEPGPAPASGMETPAHSAFAPPVEGASEPVFPCLSPSEGSKVRMVPERNESVPRGKQNGDARTPLLEKRLRQYWQLNQTTSHPEARSSELNGAAKTTPSSMAGPPVPADFVHASRRWPEFVGREISKQARVVTGQLAGEGLRSRSQRSFERVEIQNVFNIEVTNEANGTNGFDDLSERIVEILNEQALEHGIDVT